jgi:hypothetical protein
VTIKSETIKELATALAKAQAEMPAAIKDKNNPAFKGTKYADLGAIWDACRGVLTSNGLSVMQMPEEAGDGRVGLTTILLHASGEYIGNSISTRIVKDDPQGVGSGLTYLRRYALAAFVGVVADEDDDGNAASQGASYNAPRSRSARATPPPLPTRGVASDDSAIAAAQERIKAITGAASWSAMLTWLGDDKQTKPQTVAEWQRLATWIGTVAQERARATNGATAPAL